MNTINNPINRQFNILDLLGHDNIDGDQNILSSKILSDFKDTPVHDLASATTFFENLNTTTGPKFSFMTLNIRSLIKNITDLRTMLCQLQWEFNVICLQETWIKHEMTLSAALIQMDGFTFVNLPRESSSKGGGLGIYLSNEIPYKQRKDLTCSTDDIEIMTIEIINGTKRNILIANIYRPPSGKIKGFQETVDRVLKRAKFENKPTYLMGDFNLNMFEYSTDARVRDLVNIMSAHFLLPVINKPTRITRKSSSCIDNIFVNINFHQKPHAGIITEIISDHLPLFMVLEDLQVNKIPKQVSTERRIITPEKLSDLKDRLRNTSWSNVLDKKDVDNAYSAFADEFLYLFDIFFAQNNSYCQNKVNPKQMDD